MTLRRISVVIPVRNDPRVEACLASLREAIGPGVAVEVVVVDNGSTPAFSAWLDEIVAGDVAVIRLDEPGTYRARNVGVAATVGDVVFFTDADARVQPGWFEAGLALVDEGFDIVQGASGSLRDDRLSRLLQARYGARFRRLRRGAATEVDTRNLAVRRAVFERLRFDERYLRAGDTEFGLRAELLGFRVGFAPAMRILHDHDDDLRVFVAKQVAHGWGAQRIMREAPVVRWHGGHLQLVRRFAMAFERAPARQATASLLTRGALVGAAALQGPLGWLPAPLAVRALAGVDKLALLAGHLAYAPGTSEPRVGAILGRPLPRE